MPTPRPRKNENYKSFMSRFLRDKVSKREYPDIKQRFAIGVSIWRDRHHQQDDRAITIHEQERKEQWEADE